MARKVNLKQHIPEGPPSAFTVYNRQEGVNLWHVKIRDAICGDEPEFTYRLPKTAKAWRPTPQAVANSGAAQCNEGRGYIYLTRFADGVPDFSAVYVSNGRFVLCLWSTDQSIAPVEHPMVEMRDGRLVYRENWQQIAHAAIDKAQAERIAAEAVRTKAS